MVPSPLPFFTEVRYNPPDGRKWSTRRTRVGRYLFPAAYNPIPNFGEIGLVDNRHKHVILDQEPGRSLTTDIFQATILMNDRRIHQSVRLANNARSTIALQPELAKQQELDTNIPKYLASCWFRSHSSR